MGLDVIIVKGQISLGKESKGRRMINSRVLGSREMLYCDDKYFFKL